MSNINYFGNLLASNTVYVEFYLISMASVFHETSSLERLLPSIRRGSEAKWEEPCVVSLSLVLGLALSPVSVAIHVTSLKLDCLTSKISRNGIKFMVSFSSASL